jgi:(4S)-4-hydroxy-5-phosphonooxypentane-2,3-dione isomerase
MPMIVLVADYYVKAGAETTVAETLREMVAFSNSDAEPGCLLYVVNQSLEDPRKFLLYEQYQDETALEQHMQTKMFKEKVLETVVPLLEQRVRHLYRPIEPDDTGESADANR